VFRRVLFSGGSGLTRDTTTTSSTSTSTTTTTTTTTTTATAADIYIYIYVPSWARQVPKSAIRPSPPRYIYMYICACIYKYM